VRENCARCKGGLCLPHRAEFPQPRLNLGA
jgi:hypothetical protein